MKSKLMQEGKGLTVVRFMRASAITSGQARAQKSFMKTIIAAARRQNQVSSGAQASSGIGKRPTVIEKGKQLSGSATVHRRVTSAPQNRWR